MHFVKNDLGFSAYPMTPGHELAGVVTAVGKNVTKFAVGDNVGVGCMVDACQSCKSCNRFEEQYCATGSVFTYGRGLQPVVNLHRWLREVVSFSFIPCSSCGGLSLRF